VGNAYNRFSEQKKQSRTFRYSRAIALVLIPTTWIYLGLKSCESSKQWSSTTQPSYNSGGSHYHSYGSGSHSSETSRGGFGGSGRSIGS
jgi:hypothetical protein